MAEPAQRRDDGDGGKFYEHLSRTEEVDGPGGQVIVRPARYTSVTTALGILDKEALVFWAANLAARRAMENLPQLLTAALIPDCGRARARSEPYGCRVCEACIQHWVASFHIGESARRAREGTAAHDVLEQWIRTGTWEYTPAYTGDEAVDKYVPTPKVMAPYIAALQGFVDEFGLVNNDFLVSECTVWNHRLKYAGTLDFIVNVVPRTKKSAEFCARINYSEYLRARGAVTGEVAAFLAGPVDPADADLLRPVRILGDAKSREGEKVALYSENPLQLTAYRNAETMTPKHGAPEMERPMAEVDGAAVLQVRPDGWTFRPVVSNGVTMRAFEAALAAYRWESEHGDRSTQVQAFPLPSGWKWTAPTFERATTPDGKLCGCAACDDPADADCMFAGRASRPAGPHTREVTADGDPVPKKAAPRKRAPAKKATPAKTAPRSAGTSPLADLRQSFTGARATIDDADIPF